MPPVIGALGALASSAVPAIAGTVGSGLGALGSALGTSGGQFLAQTGLGYLGKEQAKQEAHKQLDEQLATQRKQNLASLLMPQKQARQRKQYYQL